MAWPRCVVAALGALAGLPAALAAGEAACGGSTRLDARVARLLSAAPARLGAAAAAHDRLPHTPHLPSRCSAGGPQSRRVTPAQFGGDPTGVLDSTAALQASVEACVNASRASRGEFPGAEDHWGPVRDAGGCAVDLAGGEYRVSAPIVVPEMVANMEFGHGSVVAGEGFPPGEFLVVVGVKGSCKFPQGSCNMDLNFLNLFLDGSNVASAMQVNNVMGTTIGPGGYFLNFTGHGLQINQGHEVMVDRCWLGETNFDFNFARHGARPRATAIEINGNDHYIMNTIVFSSRIGVQVNGAADVVKGVHVWFPVNQALAFNDTMAFYIPQQGNRFDGCYIDGGRAVFEGDGLKANLWINGFECCAGGGLGGVPHGIILKGDVVGPGLHIYGNMFQGGLITHQPSLPGKTPAVTESRITDNSFAGGGRHSRVSRSLAQQGATMWRFDLCDQLVFPVVASVQVSLQVSEGFPHYAVRPTSNCTVLVETEVPVSGSMTVFADSSTMQSDGQLAASVAAAAYAV